MAAAIREGERHAFSPSLSDLPSLPGGSARPRSFSRISPPVRSAAKTRASLAQCCRGLAWGVCMRACVCACVCGGMGDWGLGSTLVWYGFGWCDVEVDATGVAGTARRWSRYRTVYRVSGMPTLLRLFKGIKVGHQAGRKGQHGRWALALALALALVLSAEPSRSRPALVGTAPRVGLAKLPKVDTQYRGARHG